MPRRARARARRRDHAGMPIREPNHRHPARHPQHDGQTMTQTVPEQPRVRMLCSCPLLLLLLLHCAAARAPPTCAGVLPASHPKVPCEVVPACSPDGAMATMSPYSMSNGSGPAYQLTTAKVCLIFYALHLSLQLAHVRMSNVVPTKARARVELQK